MTTEEQHNRLEQIRDDISEAGDGALALLNEALNLPTDGKGESLLMEVIVYFAASADFSQEVAGQVFALLPRMQERLKNPEDRSGMDEVCISMTHLRASTFLPGLKIEKETICRFLGDLVPLFESENPRILSRLYQNIRGIMMDMGDFESAASYHQRYLEIGSPSDFYCGECHRFLEKDFEYLVSMGKDEEAWEKWQELKSRKASGCSVPDLRLDFLSYPELYLLNRRGSDAEAFSEAWARIERGVNNMNKIARSELTSADRKLRFAVFQGEWKQAIDLFQQSLGWFMTKSTSIPRFHFYCDAYLLFSELQQQGRKFVQLDFPEDSPLYRPSGRYTLKKLSAWFKEEAEALAQSLDDRNGNQHYQHQFDRLEAWGTPAFWKPF